MNALRKNIKMKVLGIMAIMSAYMMPVVMYCDQLASKATAGAGKILGFIKKIYCDALFLPVFVIVSILCLISKDEKRIAIYKRVWIGSVIAFIIVYLAGSAANGGIFHQTATNLGQWFQ